MLPLQLPLLVLLLLLQQNGHKVNNLYPFSMHVATFNFITNSCTYLIKNYHNSHLKPTR